MPVKTLKEVYEECISLTKGSFAKYINGGSFYKWRGQVGSDIIGEFKYDGFPNFGLNIYDETQVIRCLVLNPVKNVEKLLKFYGHIVVVKDPELVVEIFIKNQEYSSVHVLIRAENVHVIEKNIRQFFFALKGSKTGGAADNWEQKFVPLKVSSVLLTLDSKMLLCLVLASLVDSDSIDESRQNLVWLIFQDGQTLWKDLLLPFQIYNIVIPRNISRDHFSKYKSLTSIVDGNLDISFLQILHHNDFVKRNAAVYLPEGARLTTISHSSVVLPPERWYSVSDSKLKYLKFASVVGVIREVRYFDSFKSQNCSWCSYGNEIFEATLEEPPDSETNVEINSNNEWIDTFTVPSHADENANLHFPNVSFKVPNDQQIEGFGIKGGKMCVQITLQSELSTDMVSIYLKRWRLQQYPAGLVNGVTVCVTDVNIKKSKHEKTYFISTPFTRIVYLDTDHNERAQSIQLMKFGFPSSDRFYQKIWGIMELELPLKVSIAAKCKACNYSFLNKKCSNIFCTKFNVTRGTEFDIVASARVFVHNLSGSEMSTLCMKNENVQKYLGLPGRLWQLFCKLSVEHEFCYLFKKEDDFELDNVDSMTVFYHLYCKNLRLKRRFHVICTQFRDDLNGFFCVDLEEITDERINFAHFNYQKAIEENRRK